jgi:1,4-alpha-glucan branching enzyme
MWAHPGKQLLFMGAELAPEREWDHDHQLDWWILEQWDAHRKVKALLADVNRVYKELPALWEEDFDASGFEWIDASDNGSSVLSFLRWGHPEPSAEPTLPSWPIDVDGPGQDATRSVLACVANLTPVPRTGYRVGLPFAGRWIEAVNTDATEFGGSGIGNAGAVEAEHVPWHGQRCSAELTLPPLAVLWLRPG